MGTITRLDELCTGTFLQRLKVHHSSYGETDLRISTKNRNSSGEKGSIRMKKIIIAFI